ncbi:MAG TPA: glutamine--tRNA ligase/YqeY domain fusion protein [Anaerolineae bacterium]|nr:glutamine--tRNA ligase/YqeY domain fusion protein [Anaerolineae bacterium]
MNEPADKATVPADLNEPLDFIREAVLDDIQSGRFDGRVHTRFPPEPNGYLHIGHTKAICINYGIAEDFGGLYNLRFDDTNPVKEEIEFVESMRRDIRWLGFDWGDREYHASGYFQQLYEWAIELIVKGKAYVCDLSPDEVREYRGTLTEPGRNSPYRDRPVDENLDLFQRMRAGGFPDGSRTLRAKIDMASPNINMRDPVMYRIKHETHHRTGDEWPIYPMYDWAHGQSDSIERITHSLCDLGYEDHRPLYNWFLDQLEIYHPRQIEFARFNMTYTVLSKRYLKRMVDEGHITGWDDPRMPTLAGMRRRGYPPEAIRAFIDQVGISKSQSMVDIEMLEHFVRQHLNLTAPRVMAVLDPLKIVIVNYPEDQVEHMEAINNPENASAGARMVPFSRELYIEHEDFMEAPPKRFWRLAPGREVRLRYAYFITCVDVVKDENGEVVELHCTYDPATRGGDAPDGRRVKATLHWVSAPHALDAEVRTYDQLFTVEDPLDVPEGADFTDYVNAESLQVSTCKIEPSVAGAEPGTRYQFERKGYYCVDLDATGERMVFNSTVSMRDTWAKIQRQMKT